MRYIARVLFALAVVATVHSCTVTDVYFEVGGGRSWEDYGRGLSGPSLAHSDGTSTWAVVGVNLAVAPRPVMVVGRDRALTDLDPFPLRPVAPVDLGPSSGEEYGPELPPGWPGGPDEATDLEGAGEAAGQIYRGFLRGIGSDGVGVVLAILIPLLVAATAFRFRSRIRNFLRIKKDHDRNEPQG